MQWPRSSGAPELEPFDRSAERSHPVVICSLERELGAATLGVPCAEWRSRAAAVAELQRVEGITAMGRDWLQGLVPRSMKRDAYLAKQMNIIAA